MEMKFLGERHEKGQIVGDLMSILKKRHGRNDETELELSVESRSFVNWENDQVRKRQKRIADGEKHSMIWNVCGCNLNG